MRTERVLVLPAIGCLLALTLASCGGESSSSPTAVATPAPTPAGTPTTTAVFDGNWTGTTNSGGVVSFRVLSGQLIDFALDIDFGSGCVYHAKTPASFDPVDPVFPIRTDGKVSFRFLDPALEAPVTIEFTAVRAAKGAFSATELLDSIDCPAQTVRPPRLTPAGTFTVNRP